MTDKRTRGPGRVTFVEKQSLKEEKTLMINIAKKVLDRLKKAYARSLDYSKIKYILGIKSCKKGYQKTKDKIYQFATYLKYQHKILTWKGLQWWRVFLIYFKKYFDLVLMLSFPVLGICAGLLVNKFGGINFTPDILSNYLITAGAMAGGAIAIVFTISIFLLQSAADLYSSQYFEVYIHDWKEKIIYFIVIVITIVLFGGGLYIGSLENLLPLTSAFVVLTSLFLIGLVFSLIDWQYKTVTQKINPTKAISFLEGQGIKFLNRVQADAKKLAHIILAKNSSVSEEEALAASYNQYLQPYVKNLDRQIENIVEISLKLSDKQEIETTKRGFTAVHNVLAKFFEIRKTSSIAMPSSVAFLAVESDSQRFVFDNFERLNKAGEKFIKESKDVNATYILDVYNSLAIKIKDISYVGRSGENPILENLIGCLENYIDIGMREKNLEVVFQGLEKLGNIALITAEKGLSPSLEGLQKKILKIALYGLTEKQTIIVDRCNSIYLKIIVKVFVSRNIIAKHHLDTALESIAIIAQYVFVAKQAGYLSNDYSALFTVSKAYDELYNLIASIVNYYPNITEDREKSRYRSDIVEFLDELYKSLRSLSEKIKNCDSTLTDSIGRLLFNVNSLIITLSQHADFSREKPELIKQLGWNIHLPTWFAHHAEKFDGGSNAFNSLVESVAKTGILASEILQDKELVKTCIDSLFSLTKHALKKTTSGYGYDEPRVLEKACYLGILALKKGWEDIATYLGLKIYEFEELYIKKHIDTIPAHIDKNAYGLPKKDQLEREISIWRSDFDHEKLNGNLRIRDDAESMMYEFIETIDIDRFTFEVWGVIQGDNGIEEEIEEKLKKRTIEQEKTDKKIEIQKLVNVLSKKNTKRNIKKQ